MGDVLEIDGNTGEGGGQILRTSLGLSLVTGKAFRIYNIRGRRSKPGLLRQHLTAVRAAAEIGGARVRGAELGSRELRFEPGEVRPGRYRFAVGTAGSTTLVMQAVLPALLMADGDSEITVEGGTHNPWAPPFEFLEIAYVPLLTRLGANVSVHLERPGFHPAGGGALRMRVRGGGLRPADFLERGETVARHAVAIVSSLPAAIARRELAVVRKKLGLEESECRVHEIAKPRGPGNLVNVTVESEHIVEVFTAFGEKTRRAEVVAQDVAEQVRAYLRADVPIGPYLADQLVLALALAGGGSFRTMPLSQHTLTNAVTIAMFLPVRIDVEEDGKGRIVRVR